jgi:hypothetical protein
MKGEDGHRRHAAHPGEEADAYSLQDPEEEHGEVERVKELAQGNAGTIPHGPFGRSMSAAAGEGAGNLGSGGSDHFTTVLYFFSRRLRT